MAKLTIEKLLRKKQFTQAEVAKMFESLLPDGGDDGEDIVSSAAENAATRDFVAKEWSLGPAQASVDPKANGPYWRKMASLWQLTEAEARRQLCANCEYFNNTPAMQEKMEAIPLDKFDMDGGGRGYCEKFDFICHNLRTCQAWEEKEFNREDGED